MPLGHCLGLTKSSFERCFCLGIHPNSSALSSGILLVLAQGPARLSWGWARGFLCVVDSPASEPLSLNHLLSNSVLCPAGLSLIYFEIISCSVICSCSVCSRPLSFLFSWHSETFALSRAPCLYWKPCLSNFGLCSEFSKNLCGNSNDFFVFSCILNPPSFPNSTNATDTMHWRFVQARGKM